MRKLIAIVFLTNLLIGQMLLAQNPYPAARYGQTSVWIGDSLYVFGGATPSSKEGGKSMSVPNNDLWMYGETDESFQEVQDVNPPDARSEHVAVLYNGSLYVHGGKGNDPDNYQQDIVRYDPATNSWTHLQPGGYVPYNMAEHAAAVWNDKIWVFAGRYRFQTEDQEQRDWMSNYLFSYDPATNQWDFESTMGDVPPAMKGHSMVAKGDKFVVFGGKNESNERLDKVYELDMNTRLWTDRTPAGDKPTARAYHRAVAVGDKMRILGGNTDQGSSAEVWDWDYESGNFSRQDDMPVALQRFSGSAKAQSSGHDVYVLQGQEGSEIKEESYRAQLREGEDDRWERYEKTEQRWVSTDGVPTLTLSKQLVTHEPICLDCNGEPVTVYFITIAVNEVDSWMLYSVQFRSSGSGDEVTHIAGVDLYEGSQLLSTGTYQSDDGLLTLDVNRQLQPGESITLKMVYNFQPDLQHNYEVWTYAAETSVARVNAEPDNYTEYEKLPPEVQGSSEVILAPVINLSTMEGFGSIQGSIQDDDTEDAHTISVCPGLYEENIVVHKSLTIQSRDGRDVTTVAGDVNGHVFRVQSNDTKINGFTIRGKGQNDPWYAAGISCDSLVRSCTISNNLIKDNYYAGILLWSSSDCRITGNRIRENLYAGIRLMNASGNNTIGGTAVGDRNVISKNGENGIEMAYYSGKNGVPTNTLIIGNYIGTDESGTDADGNGYDGVFVETGTDTRVGGCSAAERNIISANGRDGVSGADTVWGNYIGTDVSGTLDLGNTRDGVYKCLLVGGSEKGARNLISGNGGNGIYSENTNGFSAIENFIGTDVSGLQALPNDGNGITCRNVGHFAQQITNNVISGNKGIGIELAADPCTVMGNYIGTDSTGTGALPNQRFGILMDECSANCLIGGTATESRNIISGNGSHGILISTGAGGSFSNEIQGNYIGLSATGIDMGNDGCGIYIAGADARIGGSEEGARNIISGNDSHGIYASGAKNQQIEIIGNYIGTNIQGSSAICNDSSGIHIRFVKKVFIGGGSGQGNVISGNGSHGIYGYYSKPTILGNLIGTNAEGNAAVPNAGSGVFLYISDESVIGSRAAGTRNLISGNTENGVTLYGGEKTRIQGNKVGTDLVGTSALGNGHNGIYLYSFSQGVVGGKSPAARNTISGNGQNGVWLNAGGDIYPNQICGNFIGTDVSGSLHAIPNTLSGIYCTDTGGNTLANNRIWYNCWGIKERGCNNVITGNSIRYNSCSTGIRLDNSDSKLIGNEISDDVGSGGIACQNGAQPTILKNNIHDNNGYGLSNEDPDVVVDAAGNWWGDASGPAEALQGNVLCDSWLENPAAVIVKASREELFIEPGASDTVTLSFCNWQDSSDVLTVELQADSLDWLQSPAAYEIALTDSMAAEIRLTIPAFTSPGAVSRIRITAVSQSYPDQLDRDSLLVRSYNAALEYLTVTPDSARLRSGGAQFYEAAGYDSSGNRVEVAVNWATDGGSITVDGLLQAQAESGWYRVWATDPATRIADSADVRILPYLERIEVEPDSITLFANGGQQFTAQGYDSIDNPVTIYPLWQADGGTMEQNGYFTAPPDSGAYRISVLDTLSEIEGAAIVFVVPQTGLDESLQQPLRFSLAQNYPNPFNPSTVIRYSVKEACQVSLKLYDLRSRELLTIVEKYQQPGDYQVYWTAPGLASGVYLYRIRMGGFCAVRKMLLMK